ncbi:MAG TPA: hypothetical protein VHG92_13165, partial [Afifellaceae bacterium]|nr:hypothetical protein [Afifellaceae bacterium]
KPIGPDLMSLRFTQAMQLLKGAPGMVLVAAGGISIYFAATGSSGDRMVVLPYFIISFGFLVGVAGIVLLFRELGPPGAKPVGFDAAHAASDIELVLGQLGMNYDILRQQTRAGFILAALFMALGVSVILAGAVGQIFGYTDAGVTAVAGVIVESVSIIGFYLFRTSHNELTMTSERLHGMLLLLDAFKRAEALPEEQRTEVMLTLIERLVEYGRDHQATAGAQAA